MSIHILIILHLYLNYIPILYSLMALLITFLYFLYQVHHLTYILPVYHALFLYIHFIFSQIHFYIHMNICYLLLHLVFHIMCCLHCYLDYFLYHSLDQHFRIHLYNEIRKYSNLQEFDLYFHYTVLHFHLQFDMTSEFYHHLSLNMPQFIPILLTLHMITRIVFYR